MSKWTRSKKNYGPKIRSRRIMALTNLEEQLGKTKKDIEEDEKKLKDLKNKPIKYSLSIKHIEDNISFYSKSVVRMQKEIETLKQRV